MGYERCIEKWTEEEIPWRRVFTLSCLTVQFVVPSVIIAYCYSQLSVWLNLRSRMYEAAAQEEHNCTVPFYMSAAELSRHRNVASIRRKRITNRMLIAIVVVYCVSWLPLNALNLLLEFYSDIRTWKYLEVLYMFTQILGSASAALNPCIFASLNKDYQRHLKSYLRSSKTQTVLHFRLRMPQILLPSGSTPPLGH